MSDFFEKPMANYSVVWLWKFHFRIGPPESLEMIS